MGCGASKGKDSNPDEIKSDMKRTKISDFDSFFDSASALLGTLEELRATFQGTREEMNEIARTAELVNPSLIEAIKVFLWSCSAHKEGKIIAAGLNFTSDPPAFTIDCRDMDWITYDFSAAFQSMIGGMVKAPGQLIDVGKLAKDIGEQAANLSKDIPGKIKGSGLNPLEQARATAYAAVNFKTVAAGLAKVPNLVKEVGECLKELGDLVPKLKDLISQADEVGKKAHEKGVHKIHEIFDQFQTAPKKTPEQIAAEAKGKKPKKGKKKGKKAEKGGDKAKEHGKAPKAHA